MALAARDLKKNFHGVHRAALDGLSLSVADRETLVVLGSSGAGKTTLLRIIAGLEKPDAGSVAIDGLEILDVAPERRRVAIVFENDALFPHLTIAANLAFALHLRGVAQERIVQRVAAIAAQLEIDAHLKKKPAALSGGERQRAALARAILSDPRVLLLDEPLAHLDPQLRSQSRDVILRLSKDGGMFTGATIHVTHDHAEALAIGDRLAIMMDGRIVQCDLPQRVYDYPQNTRIARFFGSPPMNLLDDHTETIGIRPEHVRIENGSLLRGTVRAIESTGSDAFLRIATERGELVARVAALQAPRSGDEVAVTLPEPFVRRFDRATGELLR